MSGIYGDALRPHGVPASYALLWWFRVANLTKATMHEMSETVEDKSAHDGREVGILRAERNESLG